MHTYPSSHGQIQYLNQELSFEHTYLPTHPFLTFQPEAFDDSGLESSSPHEADGASRFRTRLHSDVRSRSSERRIGGVEGRVDGRLDDRRVRHDNAGVEAKAVVGGGAERLNKVDAESVKSDVDAATSVKVAEVRSSDRLFRCDLAFLYMRRLVRPSIRRLFVRRGDGYC